LIETPRRGMTRRAPNIFAPRIFALSILSPEG
jgi:hypothetical protein